MFVTMERSVYEKQPFDLMFLFANTLYKLPHVQAVRYATTEARNPWESC